MSRWIWLKVLVRKLRKASALLRTLADRMSALHCHLDARRQLKLFDKIETEWDSAVLSQRRQNK